MNVILGNGVLHYQHWMHQIERYDSHYGDGDMCGGGDGNGQGDGCGDGFGNGRDRTDDAPPELQLCHDRTSLLSVLINQQTQFMEVM